MAKTNQGMVDCDNAEMYMQSQIEECKVFP